MMHRKLLGWRDLAGLADDLESDDKAFTGKTAGIFGNLQGRGRQSQRFPSIGNKPCLGYTRGVVLFRDAANLLSLLAPVPGGLHDGLQRLTSGCLRNDDQPASRCPEKPSPQALEAWNWAIEVPRGCKVLVDRACLVPDTPATALVSPFRRRKCLSPGPTLWIFSPEHFTTHSHHSPMSSLA